MLTRHLYISGRVQGVNYRYTMAHQARAIGVTGWCRNLLDGRVEAMVQGEPDQIQAIVQWAYQGPPYAEVTRVEVFDMDHVELFQEFEIRR